MLVKNELNKLKALDSSYYNGKSYFEENSTPNYLTNILKWVVVIFIMFYHGHLKGYLMKVLNRLQHLIIFLLQHQIIVVPKQKYLLACLKQDKVTFNHGKIVNIYIVYKVIRIANINNRDNNLTVPNALFGAVSLTKNADVNKHKYSGYGIAFDRTLHLIEKFLGKVQQKN